MFHLFSVASDEQQARYLKESTRLSGVPLTLLKIETWTGYVDKITKMKETIHSLPDDDIVCFVDAYDVIAYANTEEIVRKYLRYDHEIVFGAELGVFPGHLQGRYDKIFETIKTFPTKYMYLNSGGYIGRVGAVRSMLNWMDEDGIQESCRHGGDQNYYSLYYLDYIANKADKTTRHLCIDIYQSIFQNICRVPLTDFSFVEGRLYNRVLKEMPAFLHLNGFKTYHDTVVHLHTENKEPVMEVFFQKPLETKDHPIIIPVTYRLPFSIYYNYQDVSIPLSQI